MSRLINPATNKPFSEVNPDNRIMRIRKQIMHALRNKYDAAQTTSQNEMHWAQTDELSPNAANSLKVRKTLRSRSRYETANSGYLKGIQLSICNDFVGSGPTLQIADPRFNETQQTAIEIKWKERSKKIKLRRKLWRLRKARTMDGEAFAVRFTDTSLRGVTVNQKVVECDQFSHYQMNLKPSLPEIDGIRFSKVSGEPTAYHLLNEHPGEDQLMSLRPLDGKWVSAKNVVHWFRQDRAWLRGIPETTSTLALWALLRRYTLAVVQNAEIAADFTILLKSLQPPSTNPFTLDGDGEPTETNADNWFDSFPVDRGLMTVLPDMYELQQLDPAQPVAIYDSFVRALVQEAARPLLAPSNYALLNSGQYNMASGNLDRQVYLQSIASDRIDASDEILDKDLGAWWFEATRTTGYFGNDHAAIVAIVRSSPELSDESPIHDFRWDEVPEHVDPLKVAQAIDLLHRGGHISDIDIQEKRYNRRVETHYANLERQNKWRKENDLVHELNQTAHTIPEMDEAEESDEDGGDDSAPTNRINGYSSNGNGKHK